MSRAITPAEFRIVRTRECRMPSTLVDNPQAIAAVWKRHVVTAEWWDPTREAMVAFLLSTQSRLLGFHLVAVGSPCSVRFEMAQLFRAAVVQGATRMVVAHNHPSGYPQPSTDDIQVTRKMIKAGELLGVEVLDMVVLGSQKRRNRHYSLRENGFFA